MDEHVPTTVTLARPIGPGAARVRVHLPGDAGTARVEVRTSYPGGPPPGERCWEIGGSAVDDVRGRLGRLAHRVDARRPVYRLWVRPEGHRAVVWRWPDDPEPGGLRLVRESLESIAVLPLHHAIAACRFATGLADRPDQSRATAEALRQALRALRELTPRPRGRSAGERVDLDDAAQPALALAAQLVAERIDEHARVAGLADVVGGWREG